MNLKVPFLMSVVLVSAVMSSCQNQSQSNASTENVAAADTVKSEVNPVVETIMSRRSIRVYKENPVPREILDVILKCGINAPNGMNAQPWEVRVVDSKDFIDGVTKLYVASAKDDERMKKMVEEPGFKNMFRNAPTIICIACKENGALDCGLMGENMIIAAQSMGIGSCCLGSSAAFLRSPAAADYLKKLEFSEGYELLYVIAMGYPDESPEAKPRDASKIRYIE